MVMIHPSFQVIYGVPYHISMQAWKDYVSTVPKLKSVFHSAKEGDRSEYRIYLEYKDIEAKLSFPEGKDALEIFVDDHPLFVRALNIDQHDEVFEHKLPFLLFDQKQLESFPEGSTDIQIPEEGLPALKCVYCWELIKKEEAFAVPCIGCNRAICENCIRQQFQVALKDHERMPVTCCGKPLHPDVTKNILSNEQRANYKLRYQEMSTKRPFYCPIPICSAFIPPRKLRVVKEKVKCHSCKSSICCKCRAVAEADHICSAGWAEEDAMLHKFGYKRCPNCRMGQAKMYGCNHVRCMCGTHWCWRCARTSDNCQCHRQADDVDDNTIESDSDEIFWEDSDDNFADDTPESSVLGIEEVVVDSAFENRVSVSKEQHHTQMNTSNGTCLHTVSEDANASAHAPIIHRDEGHTVTTGHEHISTDDTQTQFDTPSMTSEDSADNVTDESRPDDDLQHAVIEVVENLDDPTKDWDPDVYDFGADPGEFIEGTWLCQHKDMQPVTKNMLNRYWMGTSEKDWWERNVDGSWERLVDCMLCQAPAKMKTIDIVEEEQRLGQAMKTKESLDGVPSEALKAQQAAKENAYWCRDCGTIFCGRCKTVIDHHLARKESSAT